MRWQTFRGPISLRYYHTLFRFGLAPWPEAQPESGAPRETRWYAPVRSHRAANPREFYRSDAPASCVPESCSALTSWAARVRAKFSGPPSMHSCTLDGGRHVGLVTSPARCPVASHSVSERVVLAIHLVHVDGCVRRKRGHGARVCGQDNQGSESGANRRTARGRAIQLNEGPNASALELLARRHRDH